MTMWVDDLADLSAWTTAGSPQNANSKMYGSFGGETLAVAQRAVTVPSGPAKFLANLNYVDRGNDLVGDAFGIYLTDESAATFQGGDHSHVIGIFISMTFNDGRHVLVNHNGTAFSDFSPTTPGQFIDTGNATYLAGILLDETYVSLFLRKSDGTKEWRWCASRSSLGFTPTQVGLYIEDNRGQVGSGIDTAGWRDDGFGIITPSTKLEAVTQSQFSVDFTSKSGISDGQQFRASIPSNYDSTKATNVVVYQHGATGKYGELQDNLPAMHNALLSAGWIVASHQVHNDSFGNSTGNTDLAALYSWLTGHFNIGKIAGVGFSMGGCTLANSVAAATIPWRAIVFSSSLLNMAWAGDPNYPGGPVFTSGTPSQQSNLPNFESAYGLSAGYNHAAYVAATGGHDPLLMPVGIWPKLLVIASPADTVASKTANADTFVSTLAGLGKAASTYTASGDHGDPSQLDPAVVVPFLTGAFAASVKYALDPLDALTPLNKTTF